MTLLVDTSVWSLLLRRRAVDPANAYVAAFRQHVRQGDGILVAGIVLQELLSGVQAPRDFEQVLRAMDPVPIVDAERETHILGAKISNTCRSRGISVGTVDALVAAICIEHGLPLLTADRDFARIAQHTKLALLPPMV